MADSVDPAVREAFLDAQQIASEAYLNGQHAHQFAERQRHGHLGSDFVSLVDGSASAKKVNPARAKLESLGANGVLLDTALDGQSRLRSRAVTPGPALRSSAPSLAALTAGGGPDATPPRVARRGSNQHGKSSLSGPGVMADELATRPGMTPKSRPSTGIAALAGGGPGADVSPSPLKRRGSDMRTKSSFGTDWSSSEPVILARRSQAPRGSLTSIGSFLSSDSRQELAQEHALQRNEARHVYAHAGRSGSGVIFDDNSGGPWNQTPKPKASPGKGMPAYGPPASMVGGSPLGYWEMQELLESARRQADEAETRASRAEQELAASQEAAAEAASHAAAEAASHAAAEAASSSALPPVAPADTADALMRIRQALAGAGALRFTQRLSALSMLAPPDGAPAGARRVATVGYGDFSQALAGLANVSEADKVAAFLYALGPSGDAGANAAPVDALGAACRGPLPEYRRAWVERVWELLARGRPVIALDELIAMFDPRAHPVRAAGRALMNV